MKRIFKISIIMSFVLLFCSACDGDVTRDLRHDGFTVGGEFICSSFFPENKDDTSYEKIKYLTGTHIVTSEGKLYEINLGQTYANKMNCKLADTQITVKAIFDNKIIKGTDNKYYYLVGENSVSPYTAVTSGDNSYDIYDLLLKGEDVVKAQTANSNTGNYYVLKTDGNVYSITIQKADRNSPATIVSTSVIYNKNDYGNTIIDFNYAGDSVNTFIRTTDKLFRTRVTNAEECSKYADIQCTYAISESESFANWKDRIIAFNGSTLITDYKKVFSVQS